VSAEWEQRLSELWASIDDHSEQRFLALMEELVAELPADSAVAAFERRPRSTPRATPTLLRRCIGKHSTKGWRASAGGER
jgi:hypothetical protein